MDSLLLRLLENDSSSDEDYDVAAIMLADLAKNEQPKHGGSVQGHEVVRRNKQKGDAKLFDERGQPENFVYDHVGTPVEPKQDEDRVYNFLEMHRKIEDPVAHSQLRDDLVEHLWQIHGNENYSCS